MKKGFTLIEMIGVIVILSLLLLLALPNIINYIKKGGETKDTVVKNIIYAASKQYMEDNQSVFKKDIKNTYCISVSTLANEGYVESPIVLSSSDEDITKEETEKYVKVTYNKKYKYELVDECTGIFNPTPMLYEGLTPVIYDEENENWVVVDPRSTDWYNYDEQRWANAVVLGTNVTKKVGDTVAIDGTEAKMMLVWIPRYEYKYTNLGNNYAGGTQLLPGEIKVNFILPNKTQPSSNDYKIHPAFTFGDKELSGIWVGKFELSTISTNITDANNLGCNETTCTSNISNLRVLPNISSLRYNDVANFFYAMKEIGNSFGLSNMDTHMIKNSEWGAVAYLSQSKYGKYGNNDYTGANKEIYQNKSTEYKTGSSNGTPSQDEYREGMQCEYDDMTDLGDGKGVCGPGASTTGNIYGIYDISGGSWESVMGAKSEGGYPISNLSGFSQISLTNESVSPKYYNIYLINDGTISCENDENCYGHSLLETKNWYEDDSSIVDSNNPWLIRGGDYYTGKSIGTFSFSTNIGGHVYYISSRVVGVGKK